MGRAYAIALNAFREAVRDRVLFGVLGLALASLLFGTSLAWLSITEHTRVLIDHGLVTVSWLANLVAIFLGASFLYKEIELRTLYVILAKPVARWQFVLGRYLGIVATSVVFIALTTSALMVLLDLVVAEFRGSPVEGLSPIIAKFRASRAARGGALGAMASVFVLLAWIGTKIPALARARMALKGAGLVLASLAVLAITSLVTYTVAPDETVYVLIATVLVVLEVAVTAALATLVSSFSTPFVTGALSLGMFLIGRSTGAIMDIKGRQLPAEILRVIRLVPEVFPNLHLYVPSRQTLALTHGWEPVLSYVGQLVLYGGFYTALFVSLASWLFRRRDLT
jgi:Cu-processing system permease protein